MSQTVALPILSTSTHAARKADVRPAIAPLETQSIEDLRLVERIKRALRATGYWPLCAIEVSANARVVRIAGRVPSYFLKQVAQETVLAAPGTHRIRNDLDVAQAT